MTHTPKPSIKDVPLSELTTLHELKRVSAEDVRAAVSAPFRQFAEQIAAAFNGEEVEHPELSAESLNAAAAQERAAKHAAEERAAAQRSAARDTQQQVAAQQPQPRTQPDPSPAPEAPAAAAPRDFFAEWEQLQAEEEQKTQVNEEDYITIPGFEIRADYQYRQEPDWVAPGIDFEVEVPERTETEDESGEEFGYGVEPEPEEDTDQRYPVRLWWPELEHEPNEIVFYRVVADDSEMVESPDAGDTLVYTLSLIHI